MIPPRRLLFIANGMLPTLQLYFLAPLAPLIAAGRITASVLTETHLKEASATGLPESRDAWFRRRIEAARPDVVICCRYSGPCAATILKACRDLSVPLVMHVDDDLLNVPRAFGEAKFAYHNNPKRLASMRMLLEGADLIYCSTANLEHRLRRQGFRRPIRHGAICCAPRIRRRPGDGPIRRIGYMGSSDHAADLEMIRPALEAVLARHPQLEFELFSAMAMPEGLARFGSRVRLLEPVRDYQGFLQALADRAWDIGLCPLTRTEFNAAKSDIKWIEYSASGMAVIASAGLVYDHCMRNGRGLLVDDHEWEDALNLLVSRPAIARAMAEASQLRVLAEYSENALRAQVLSLLDEAVARHAAGAVPLAPLVRAVA